MVNLIIITVGLFLAALPAVLGDGNDWVNVDYLISTTQGASSSDSSTSMAIKSILRGADQLFNKGPWSVTNEKGILPPSKDARDYLSWAPYHWPDCRWCSKNGRTQLAHTRDPSGNVTSDPETGDPGSDFDPEDGGSLGEEAVHLVLRSSRPYHRRRMTKVRRHDKRLQSVLATGIEMLPSELAPLPTPAAPKFGPGGGSLDTKTLTTSRVASTHAPAQAAAKTTKTTCTPSPTSSIAPSATWTTCHYVGRDGQVNPDVRTLNGPGAINTISQYVLYGCISAAVDRTSKHARGSVDAIDTFFLSSSTGMKPNVQYGQIVRGPGPAGISGTFTGILDLRGLVKVINAMLILRGIAHPEWTTKRDLGMQAWLAQYGQWLTDSNIGKMAASRPNNHGTFYLSQVVAAKIYAGAKDEATALLLQFFQKQFFDQIAASGEQPFEAIRTRPYHYRCFNLEALITNAKLGDHLGLNLWSSRSRYGATIQTAMDFVIASNPGKESVAEAIPHVAAVAAAYGDPQGKYSAFLNKNMKNYQTKPFWLYDQPQAVGPNSKKRTGSKRDGSDSGSPVIPSKIPFVCPAVFQDATRVEIDDGLFVTCEDLRPLYEAALPTL